MGKPAVINQNPEVIKYMDDLASTGKYNHIQWDVSTEDGTRIEEVVAILPHSEAYHEMRRAQREMHEGYRALKKEGNFTVDTLDKLAEKLLKAYEANMQDLFQSEFDDVETDYSVASPNPKYIFSEYLELVKDDDNTLIAFQRFEKKVEDITSKVNKSKLPAIKTVKTFSS